MIYEVLYCIHPIFNHKNIIVIKPEGWKWGKGELDTTVFKIVKLDLSDNQKAKIEGNNLYRINATGDGLANTLGQYVLADAPLLSRS